MSSKAIDIATEWFGETLEKEVIEALKEGVDESTGQIFRDAYAGAKVLTGHNKSTAKTIPAKVGRKEVYGRVGFYSKYSVFQELRDMNLRRALIKNGQSSLKNFEGKLGYGKRKGKK